jgi:hypothetical protein
MTTPHSEGWYDDPDGSDAERYFDGQDWTPQRRRKEPTPKRPSQISDPHGPGSAYPYAASGPYVPPAPAGPAIPYDAYPPAPPPYAYGPPPPTGPVDPYGPVPPGYPQQPALSRLGSGMATGVARTLGVLIAASGLALVVAAFVPWAKARQVGTDQGAVVSATASFPGLGEPRISGTYSDGAIAGNMNVNSPLFQLHNTDPGWIALALGIVAVLAGAAYLWLPQRKIAAIAVAILGCIGGVICVSHFFDVRATVGNPPNLADVNFSPGAGLVAACLLSFAVAGLGVWAYMVETKSNHSPY